MPSSGEVKVIVPSFTNWEWLQYTVHILQSRLPLYLNLLPFSHCCSDYFLDYSICEYTLIPNIPFLCLNEIQKGDFGGNYNLEILNFKIITRKPLNNTNWIAINIVLHHNN